LVLLSSSVNPNAAAARVAAVVVIDPTCSVDLPSARGDGLVHGDVGALQEQLGVLAVVGAEPDPDAAGHLELELLDGRGRPRVARTS
jgi:hypothetical protein